MSRPQPYSENTNTNHLKRPPPFPAAQENTSNSHNSNANVNAFTSATTIAAVPCTAGAPVSTAETSTRSAVDARKTHMCHLNYSHSGDAANTPPQLRLVRADFSSSSSSKILAVNGNGAHRNDTSNMTGGNGMNEFKPTPTSTFVDSPAPGEKLATTIESSSALVEQPPASLFKTAFATSSGTFAARCVPPAGGSEPRYRIGSSQRGSHTVSTLCQSPQIEALSMQQSQQPTYVHHSKYDRFYLTRMRHFSQLCFTRLKVQLCGLWAQPFSTALQATKLLVLLVALLFICRLCVRLTMRHVNSFFTPTEAQLVQQLSSIAEPWSVLVQHDGAATRLNVSRMHELVEASCARKGTQETCNDRLVVAKTMLPSWTLHEVSQSCAECLDTHTYKTAIQNVRLQKPYGVFATSAAPLGRIGPMLFAMSSVTNDIAVQQELPRWSWMRHVYANFAVVPGEGGEGKTTSSSSLRPYLAVMGVPSTDQPARVALRTAQRATWMTYQEVARAENDFNGALLPLYIFGGSDAARLEEAVDGLHHVRAPACGDVASLLPQSEEFNVASRVFSAPLDGFHKSSVTKHYVSLRPGWRSAHEGLGSASPCASTFTVAERDSVRVAYASALREMLELPVTPAYVAPAQYVCCASAPLWREALEYRNMLWVDMLTDRRPTTSKKLGDDGGWGMPVEVGMTQKLILWLFYAYHAFSNVPYIIKGDDDVYVKVPQFLSDVRYVQGGVRHRAPPPPLQSSFSFNKTAGKLGARSNAWDGEGRTNANDALSPEVVLSPDATECVYWGSLRHHEHTQFNAGMLYLLHRRVVQALLEKQQLMHENQKLDIVRLATEEFSLDRSEAYRILLFDHEDIFTGLRVYDALDRIKEVCRNGRLWYVKEWYARFHDLHVGRVHNLTWSTVVAHRCRPADSYFLHHFFQTEYEVSSVKSEDVENVEKAVRRAAVDWIAAQLRNGAREDDGWDNLPAVRWTRDVTKAPNFTVAAQDNVAVYNIPYEYWRHAATSVEDGYRSQPQW